LTRSSAGIRTTGIGAEGAIDHAAAVIDFCDDAVSPQIVVQPDGAAEASART
jgi:hypothetical protein